MDDFFNRIESGVRYEQRKISDEEFQRTVASFARASGDRQLRDKKRFDKLFYRKDVNLLLPVTNGRVGRLASPIKKRRPKKRAERLKRTQYCPEPLDERLQWNNHFGFKEEKAPAPYTGPVYTRVRPVSAVNQIRALATETLNFDGDARRNSVDSIFNHMEQGSVDDIGIGGADVNLLAASIDGDGDPFPVTAATTGNDLLATNEMENGTKYVDNNNDILQEVNDDSADEEYAERVPREIPPLREVDLEFVESLDVNEVRLFIIKLGFQHYSKRVHDMGVSGQDLSICNEFDLNLMGFNYRPHRVRMLKFLDKLRGKGQTKNIRTQKNKLLSLSSDEPLNVRRFLTRRDLQQEALDISMNAPSEDDQDMAPESNKDIEIELQQMKEQERQETEYRAVLEKITETYRSSRQCLQLFEGRRGVEATKAKPGRDVKVVEEKKTGDDAVKNLIEVRGKIQEQVRERRRSIDSEYESMAMEAAATAESALISRRQDIKRLSQIANKSAHHRASELLGAKIRTGRSGESPKRDSPRSYKLEAEVEKTHLEKEARIKADTEVEAERVSLEEELRMKSEAEAETEAEMLRLEEEAKTKAEAEAKAEAEVERLRVEEEARVKAEAEAERVRVEEEARVKAEAEAERVRVEEEARVKAEAEAKRVRVEEEARVKAEAEAEAERSRLEEEEEARVWAVADAEAEAENERVRLQEAEEARVWVEAEAKAAAAEAEVEKQRVLVEDERRRLEEKERANAEPEAKSEAKAEKEHLRVEESALLASKAVADRHQTSSPISSSSSSSSSSSYLLLLPQDEQEGGSLSDDSKIEIEIERGVEEEARVRAEAEAEAKAETVRLEEEARVRAEAEAEAETVRLEEEARVRAEAEAEAEARAETVRLEEEARVRAKAEAEAEKERLEEEARVRAEAEAEAAAGANTERAERSMLISDVTSVLHRIIDSIEDSEADRLFAEEAERFKMEAQRLRESEASSGPVASPVKTIRKVSTVTVGVHKGGQSPGSPRTPRSSGTRSYRSRGGDLSGDRSNCSREDLHHRDSRDDYSYSSYTRSSYSSYSYYSDSAYSSDRHGSPLSPLSPEKAVEGDHEQHRHHVHHRHHGDPHTPENAGWPKHGHHKQGRLHQRDEAAPEEPPTEDTGNINDNLDQDSKASSITMGDASIPEPSRKALGGGWEKIEESGNVFYYNSTTNEVSNSPPRGIE